MPVLAERPGRQAARTIAQIVEHIDGYELDTVQLFGLNEGIVVVGPNEAHLLFADQGEPGQQRMVVTAKFPAATTGRTPTAEQITVGSDRGPEAIAHEIRHRLLPIYEPKLAALVEERDKHLGRRAGRKRVVEELLTLVPGATYLPHEKTVSHMSSTGAGTSSLSVSLDEAGELGSAHINRVPIEVLVSLVETYGAHIASSHS